MPSSEPAFPPTPDPFVASVTDPVGQTTMSYDYTDPSAPRTEEITISRYNADGVRIAAYTVLLNRDTSNSDEADGDVPGRNEEDGTDRPHIIVTDPGDGDTGDYRKE